MSAARLHQQSPDQVAADDEKRFSTLQAEFALLGHALVKARPDDHKAPFYLMRWGWLKPLGSLAAAERALREIGGRR